MFIHVLDRYASNRPKFAVSCRFADGHSGRSRSTVPAASAFGEQPTLIIRDTQCLGLRRSLGLEDALAAWQHRDVIKTVWKRAVGYGVILALGAVALHVLDYDQFARSRPIDIYVGLVAAAFLALGTFIGTRYLASPPAVPFDGNPAAVTSLGISPRELTVLQELAEGRSNKEIARRLQVSPNTVKTHIARLYQKLGVERRTQAIDRARQLGILA